MVKNKRESIIRICGAMVARLTPDQKVACSIHVSSFDGLLLNAFQLFDKMLQSVSNRKKRLFEMGKTGDQRQDMKL
ncbi:hypothetical protein QVD17_17898 [Tagetes erecta]|uniref:Uncharacterized protein n=1 Tax=Tagetes erecta TaxID=13708 RepID=A0AAD8NVA7_TARER|nr:hypothetical protein QVD17_17898 [Tagetes erecta]